MKILSTHAKIFWYPTIGISTKDINYKKEIGTACDVFEFQCNVVIRFSNKT